MPPRSSPAVRTRSSIESPKPDALPKSLLGSSSLPDWLEAERLALAQDPAHAFLLQGPTGLFALELALSVANAWLCEAPLDKVTQVTPCGCCPGCHLLASRTHPDLRVLMPETWALAEQWPLPEPIQQELDDKKRKPSQEIRVEPLREAISWAQQTSSRGQGLVMILVPAERMNAISANTLLKTLEEPVGNTRFILICHDEHHLLPTLRSRCQVRSIPRPTEQQGVHFLINHGLSHSEASLSFKLAAGRPQDALAAQTCSFAQPSFYARFPKAVAQGDDSLLEALQDASAYQWIDLLQKLCHDLYLCRVGATPWFFNQADLPENSTSLSLKALNTWHKQLSQAKRQADHPFQAELMRHAFMAQAQHVFTSRA